MYNIFQPLRYLEYPLIEYIKSNTRREKKPAKNKKRVPQVPSGRRMLLLLLLYPHSRTGHACTLTHSRSRHLQIRFSDIPKNKHLPADRPIN